MKKYLPSVLTLSLTALASCCLASHVLCSLATPLFFSYIRLMDSIGCSILVKQAMKLNEILTVQKNIAASVHTLTLCFNYQTLEDSRSVTLISTILDCLPHVRKFALEANYLCDVSRGVHVGHPSVVQISESFDIVPSAYSRFSFYNHRGVPQLAMSSHWVW